MLGVLLLAGAVYLFMTSQSELAPQEDQGVVLSQIIGPPECDGRADAEIPEADVRDDDGDAGVRRDRSRSPACRRSTRASAACC